MAAAILAALTAAIFLPVLNCGFVSFDDPETTTPHGISQIVVGNWIPVTTFSHNLDAWLYGTEAWGHHLTNVIFHSLAAALLFIVIRLMTGDVWRSVFVAIIFAVHPLRVESVVWVSERKDVLSGVFFMLTLLAYFQYTCQPTRLRYLSLCLCFTLGLMAKSMLVTVPLLLFLLDYWPLRRRPDFLEKIPLFCIAAIAGIVQLWSATPVIPPDPLIARVENAAVSYLIYLWRFVWPTKLAIFYPRHPWPFFLPVAAIVFLAGVTWIIWSQRKKRSYLLVGWLWFIIALLPVIGLIQTGELAWANRYTYLPFIGLSIALAWSLSKRNLIILTPLVVLFCIPLTWAEITYWHDSESLFRHALSVQESAVAHTSLGLVIEDRDPEEAISEYKKAVAIKPDYALAQTNLGLILATHGRLTEALPYLETAVNLRPDIAEAHNNFGLGLAKRGRLNDAVTQFELALKLKPNFPAARRNLALVKGQAGPRSDKN